MNLVKKFLLCSALCVTMIGQTVSVGAATQSTPVCNTSGGSGYTLYVYTQSGTFQLGKMHVYMSGSTAVNAFTATYYCAPRVYVGTDPYNMVSGGSIYTYVNSGSVVKKTKAGSSSSNAYGQATVAY